MPNKTARGPSNKAYFTKYVAENRAAKNQEKRLERHLKHHPNDRQSVDNLGKPANYKHK